MRCADAGAGIRGADLPAKGVITGVGADAGFADAVLGAAVDRDGDRGVGGVGVCRGLGDGAGGRVDEGAGEGLVAEEVLGDEF